ncbi:MAG TPA: serine/threonine protein phosphatase [Pseudonocardiaceae bacterium]|nr:serine/threonine protein phosphatase [Pseudonocardiaceae bacterium]
MAHQTRLARYGDVATALALLGDHQLGRLVDAGQAVGSGIGGSTALLDIAGTPVFVKRIPLTDLERLPANVMSTANVFELPTYCHYGVVEYGAAGFGAWRELAANTMTTDWVLTERSEAFPLMYHWRVLPGAAPLTEELVDIDRVVAYWHNSAAVRRRLDALATASASVVLFLEHVPQRLDDWLAGQLAAGTVTEACAMVRRCLSADVAFMNTNGLLHFDAHFRNILTDGHRLYFADLGLATSPRFDLSRDERDFLALNANHDAGYAARELLNWIVANVVGIPGSPADRYDYLRRCAAGAHPVGAPAPIAELISRYAPVAAIMNAFYWDVYGESRTTPYPAEEIARAIGASAG